MTFTDKLKSRKFLIVIVTFIVGGAATLFGVDLDPNVVYGFIAVALGFIGVEGLADNSSRKLDGSFAVRMIQAELADMQAAAEGMAEEVYERAAEIGQDAVPGGFGVRGLTEDTEEEASIQSVIGADARARSGV